MKTDIDNLLKEWSLRHSPGGARLDRIAGHIAVEAARRNYLGVSLPVNGGGRLWGKLACGVLGACAAIVVIALGWGYSGASAGARVSQSIAALAKPSDRQMGAIQKVFAETSRLFPKQLRWLVQSNGDIGLGVESDAGAPVPDTPAMLVRLVLVKRAAGEKIWRPAWTTDIVMRGEDRVEIVPNREGHNKVSLWLYQLEKGMVAVDTSICIEQPLRVSARLDAVIGLGEPAVVVTSSMGGDEYKLLQTVEPLKATQRCKS